MGTTEAPFWEEHPGLSVAPAPAQRDPTVDVTLQHLVTKTTVTYRLSATVTRVTQVGLRS